MGNTLVLGAATAPEKYANRAIRSLRQHGYPVVAVGIDEGEVVGVPIRHSLAEVHEAVDSVTLYLNPLRQRQYYDGIVALAPRRVIFNPGTENPELSQRLSAAGIESVEACTLVMLATGQY